METVYTMNEALIYCSLASQTILEEVQAPCTVPSLETGRIRHR